jgi:hypothetical protein
MLVLTLPTSGGRSVSIVRSPTQATEFFVCYVNMPIYNTQNCVHVQEPEVQCHSSSNK